uniref:Ig-like domain-containing protein n=1 Tax=Callorhinchus milii TaxID=7868 RepID=A0A4W3HEF5_CALMI
RTTRAPSVFLLPPSPEEMLSGMATVSCLVGDFHPGLAQVTWSVDGAETQSNVTTSGVRLAGDRAFALSSYLRVPTADWDKGSTFSCAVSHGSLTSTVLKSISLTTCSP